jgi:hypothetical protein
MERTLPRVVFYRRLGMAHIKAPRVMRCKRDKRLAPELAPNGSIRASMQTSDRAVRTLRPRLIRAWSRGTP